LSEVFEIAENITIIRDGKKVGVYPTEKLNQEKLVYIMTGRKLEYAPYVYDHAMRRNVPLLEVRSLSKANQFEKISFSLHPGEILGITGLVGSGRTEIVQAIFGLNRPDDGEIFIEGRKVEIRSPQDGVKNGIALLPEDRLTQGLFEAQSIGDNIVITILKQFLEKSRLLNLNKKQGAELGWVDKVKIKTPTPKNPVNSLSGGNQQRVVLAKWLATNPKVFILDGPTIGIDIGSKHTIHKIIRDLAKQGMGIIIISDEVQEILNNCSRVLVLAKGRVIKEIEDSTSVSSDELLNIIAQKVEEPGVEA
ncbi:MAG: ATP-binding cassette domain-containing protein, partial [Bacteroidales bacterium]|nr:ATP-binding cassette domain-containing protein [Bacteroidales bacterium]